MNKVKALLLVLAVCMTPVAARAQFHLGVKGGANIATVKFNKDIVDANNITGFLIGPMVEYTRPSTGWGFDAALLFTQKGCELENRTVKNNYLEVPVNIKLKFTTPLIRPYLAAGPYAGFRVGGRKVWDVSGLYNDVKGQVNAKSFSAGLNFSAGAEVFGFLQVGLNYGWGLTDNYSAFEVSNPDEYTGKTHTWTLSAAILF
jgi:hypothetical protein